MNNKLPRLPYQQHEKDTISYVGRDYIEYRCHKTKQCYEVGQRVKSRKDRHKEEEERY